MKRSNKEALLVEFHMKPLAKVGVAKRCFCLVAQNLATFRHLNCFLQLCEIGLILVTLATKNDSIRLSL